MKAVIFLFVQIFTFSLGDEFHRSAKILATAPHQIQIEKSADFWKTKAQSFLSSKINKQINKNKAKNIIMFLGDGMSQPTVAATRMYMGREQTQLSFDEFPHFGLTKTYCINSQTADSACSATAYLSGVKANYETIGVSGNVEKNQCEFSKDDHTESIASWAQKAGKATGIVTTTRLTDASPTGVFAHVSQRDWEANNDIPESCRAQNKNVEDIAHQLIYGEEGKKLKVILGCGRDKFINNTMNDDEGHPGLRTDGRNLINEWVGERNKEGKASYVWHNQQLQELDLEKTDFLLGLFENEDCMYNLDILNQNLEKQEPSLTDMTVAAIKMLQKDENGFFLFVEGGRIDHAHHDNFAFRALEDTKEFSRAVDMARRMTSDSDTLIVVTSDHSHVMSYNGYPERSNDILGLAGVSEFDNKPFLTLSYGNGQGYKSTYNNGDRVDYSTVDLRNPEFQQSATVPRKSETHAGEDVGVYAAGPWSHLFTGSYEQNNIPLLMAYAAEIGPYSSSSRIFLSLIIFCLGFLSTQLL